MAQSGLRGPGRGGRQARIRPQPVADRVHVRHIGRLGLPQAAQDAFDFCTQEPWAPKRLYC